MSIRKSFVAAVLSTIVVLSAFSVRSGAQILVQFYSTFAKDNVIPTECLKQRSIVLSLMLSYDHPTNWTWIIACDEAAWKRVEAHIGQMNSVHGETLGITDLESRVTYLRGFALIQPFTAEVEGQPEHTIVHELSHIILNNHDEVKVEKRARLIMQQHATQAQWRTVAVTPSS
jgi:hypothetical protein